MTEIMDAPDWHVIMAPCHTHPTPDPPLVSVAPEYRDRARCGDCVREGRPVTGQPVVVRPHTVPGAGSVIPIPRRAPQRERVPVPPPEVTNLEPWPADYAVPSACVKARERAESAGWVVRLGYSRGWVAHGTTGEPSAYGHRVGVQCIHPESRSRAVLVRVDRLDNGTSTWESITLANRSGVITDAAYADAVAFLAVAGRVLPDIRAWHVQQVHERAVKRAARAPRQRKGGTSREVDTRR